MSTIVRITWVTVEQGVVGCPRGSTNRWLKSANRPPPDKGWSINVEINNLAFWFNVLYLIWMCNRKYNWSVFICFLQIFGTFGKYLELLAVILNYSRFSAVPINHLLFDLSLPIEGDPCSSSSNCPPLAGVVHVEHVTVVVHVRVGPGDRLGSICTRDEIKVDSCASFLVRIRNFAHNIPAIPDIKRILTVPWCIKRLFIQIKNWDLRTSKCVCYSFICRA